MRRVLASGCKQRLHAAHPQHCPTSVASTAGKTPCVNAVVPSVQSLEKVLALRLASHPGSHPDVDANGPAPFLAMSHMVRTKHILVVLASRHDHSIACVRGMTAGLHADACMHAQKIIPRRTPSAWSPSHQQQHVGCA